MIKKYLTISLSYIYIYIMHRDLKYIQYKNLYIYTPHRAIQILFISFYVYSQ